MALLRKLQCMNPNINGDMYMNTNMYVNSKVNTNVNTNMNTNMYVNTKVSANGQFRAPDSEGRAGGGGVGGVGGVGGGGGSQRPMANRWTQPQVT